MVRRSFTAVIEKNTTFEGPFETEPYEAGWAGEARWFIRVIELTGTLDVFAQLSPDGLFWCYEGGQRLSMKQPGMASFAMRDFGGWLRLRVELEGKAKVMIYLVLKE